MATRKYSEPSAEYVHRSRTWRVWKSRRINTTEGAIFTFIPLNSSSFPLRAMAAGTATSILLPPVKSVVVYKNGDPFYSGRRFVVNQRQVSTMEAFLTEVTQCIGAPLAVRNLYTPRQGHRVTDLQELRTGAQYVAAGFERFKKLDYVNVGVKKQSATREETQTKVIQRPNVSAKWRKFIPIPCIIHVFRNGDLLCPPFRFIIPRNMQQDLEQILSLVTDKVSLRTGAVRRLCSLEGAPVSSASELETGHSYVAVGTERFKKLPYVELLVSKAAERHYPGKRRMLRRNENRKEVNGTEDQYSDSALLNSPESDGRRVKSTGDEAPQATQQRYRGVGPEDPSVFFSRPVNVRKNRGHPLTNRAARHSVFKRVGRRRREEVRGAEEVAEDENTATELPIDQRVAETVEDEELIATEPLDRNRGVSSRTDDNQETFEDAENKMNKIKDSTKHEEPQDHDQKDSLSKSRPSSQERLTKSPRIENPKTGEQKRSSQDIVTNGVGVSS